MRLSIQKSYLFGFYNSYLWGYIEVVTKPLSQIYNLLICYLLADSRVLQQGHSNNKKLINSLRPQAGAFPFWVILETATIFYRVLEQNTF